MKTLKQTLGISLLLVTLLNSIEVLGQKRNSSSNRGVQTERKVDNGRVGRDYRGDNRYRTQPIRKIPHYGYPRHRRVVRTLPIHHVRILYRGLPYYYHSGIYYTAYGSEYVVVMPPIGFRINVLPVGHVRIVVGPSVYFYHSGLYYSKTVNVSANESVDNYEVTSPPVGIEVTEIPEDVEEIMIDGVVFYEYNDVIYKKITNEYGEVNYKVVYSKSNNN